MIRSALIIGAIAFIYMLVTNVAQIACAPFLAVIFGLMAGALAVVFDKPQMVNKAVVSGALAGLISSIGATVGTVAGLAIRIFGIFGPNTFATIIPGLNYTQSDVNAGIFAVFCCCICTTFVLMAAFGALGGFLGFQYKNRKPAVPPAPPSV